jgi:hypothetical protein
MNTHVSKGLNALHRPLFYLIAVAALSHASLGDVLYDQSNVRTGIGNGANGADTSSMAANASYPGYPFTAALTPPVWLAEQFTLSSLSLVDSVVFLAESTWPSYGVPPNSPFFGATMNIWNGQPGAAGSTIVASSNLLTDSRWTGIYRVDSSFLTGSLRPIMSVTLGFNNVALSAGTYYAAWSITLLIPGGTVFQADCPPVMNPDGTMPAGTALQTLDGINWNAAVDPDAGYQVGLPIKVTGSAIPEPDTGALVLLGSAFAVYAFRRRAGWSLLLLVLRTGHSQ